MAAGGSSSTAEVDTPGPEDFREDAKVVLILCGLIASGKFRRCNQDDLGDRRRVEQLARESLDRGQSVCIDRTNFNPLQRSYWIEIAREFPGTLIWVIVFDTPYEICASRLQKRTSHPTITNVEQGLSVLSRFAADFQRPTAREGFDRVLYVKPSDHTSPIYTRSDISAILHRVRDSPPLNARPSRGFPPQSRSGIAPGRRGASNSRGRRAWGGEPGRNYSPVPRGRGTYSGTGSVNGFRGWQPAGLRGSNTGFRGAGQLHAAIISSSRNTDMQNQVNAAASTNTSSSETDISGGSGAVNDPLTID
ncbi:hypothetical protein BDQ12DRAFT_665256 [Crucibulum laeve]|uniref:AAA domain-containing protein n=1 Tax=Crucibulum laeve TaxID=68775 RepID=A0A5C3M3I8_9AGAR|nr:hypothetical protein BDQ12DRAFT_665256 [Crucibulum laeve]